MSMSYIDTMTADEIAASIAELRKLGRTGKITPAQADELHALEMARARIRHATRRCNWRYP
jgi:hypothetical protein